MAISPTPQPTPPPGPTPSSASPSAPASRIRYRGVVRKLLSNGCGFIQVTRLRDHFFHKSDLEDPALFALLREGPGGSILDFESESDDRRADRPQCLRARKILIVG